VEIDYVVLQVTTSKESIPKQDQLWEPSFSQKGNEVVRINFVQAQVE
jgi:hypothetical protein